MTGTALLTFERPAAYLHRAVRYLVEVDGAARSPRLTSGQMMEVEVAPGEHVVRVSAGSRRFFESRVTVAAGAALRLLVRPSSPLTGRRRQPRLRDVTTGRYLGGAIGTRPVPLTEPIPQHHP